MISYLLFNELLAPASFDSFIIEMSKKAVNLILVNRFPCFLCIMLFFYIYFCAFSLYSFRFRNFFPIFCEDLTKLFPLLQHLLQLFHNNPKSLDSGIFLIDRL